MAGIQTVRLFYLFICLLSCPEKYGYVLVCRVRAGKDVDFLTIASLDYDGWTRDDCMGERLQDSQKGMLH
jgi:hypothetical protein